MPVSVRRPSRLKVLTALVLGVLTVLPAGTSTAGAPRGAGSSISNSELLARLEVRAEVTSPRYERSAFRHWVDADGDCQDTRVEVLVREDRAGSRHGCRATTGTWVSWLDGRTSTASRGLDVDHLVALAEAWGSGAYAWTWSTREAFANDLGYEWSLRAVTASVNRSKSDRDPAGWLPAAAVRCEYVSRWMAVKYRWGLSVDPAERSAILRILEGSCGGASVVLPALAPGLPAEGVRPVTSPLPIPSAPATPAPSPATPAESTPPAESSKPVTPGAFCAPAGATGVSAKGVVYVCRTSDTDTRNRWRR